MAEDQAALIASERPEVWIDQEGSLWQTEETERVRYAVAFPDPDEPECLVPRMADTLEECRLFMAHRLATDQTQGVLVTCVETTRVEFSPWVFAHAGDHLPADNAIAAAPADSAGNATSDEVTS